jgi:hypothetical protein
MIVANLALSSAAVGPTDWAGLFGLGHRLPRNIHRRVSEEAVG